MNPYKQIVTDLDIERKGAILDYGVFRVTVARMGGNNIEFSKLLTAKAKPVRRALSLGILGPDAAEKLVIETAAETAIKLWEVKDDEGNWRKGMHNAGGDVVEFNQANVIELLTTPTLSALWEDIKEQGSSAATYRPDGADAGN